MSSKCMMHYPLSKRELKNSVDGGGRKFKSYKLYKKMLKSLRDYFGNDVAAKYNSELMSGEYVNIGADSIADSFIWSTTESGSKYWSKLNSTIGVLEP